MRLRITASLARRQKIDAWRAGCQDLQKEIPVTRCQVTRQCREFPTFKRLGGPPCCPLTTSPDFQSPCVTRPPDSPSPSVSCVPSPCLSPALPISLLPISLLPTSRLPFPYLPSSCLAVSHSPCLPVPLLSPLTFVFISLFWREPPHLYLHYLIPGSASLCTRYRDPDRWRIDGNILVLKQKFSNCNFYIWLRFGTTGSVLEYFIQAALFLDLTSVFDSEEEKPQPTDKEKKVGRHFHPLTSLARK